jgi:hypothetical protein
MKVSFENTNSSFTKMKSYLDTHLIVVHVAEILILLNAGGFVQRASHRTRSKGRVHAGF